MTAPTWTNCRVRLGDLKPWAENPRTSTKAQARRILKSFEQFGQVAPVAIGPDCEVYDGHQRLSALLTVHGAGYEIEARRSSRPLTDDERRSLVLALANATGSWNWDSLSNWDTSTLSDWGFDKDTLKGWKSDVTALGEFLNSEEEAGEKYSQKIEAPIYEIKGEKPKLPDLFDTSKTDELIKDIDAADLLEEEKEFLRLAAYRHTVFDFGKIAEYYAHSDEATQELMENSALVIIDFDKAIENGYVRLSKDLQKIREQNG